MKTALPWRSWLPEFVLLGMIWGSSFFFTRMATQAFGPWSTAWMRVMVAAITLVPFVLWQRQTAALRSQWLNLLGMGLFNSAVPFFCFAFALQYINTGLSSILNSTTPLFGALIAKTGAARTMTLTYLIPLFANLIGVWALDEVVTPGMLLSGAVILLGTALASGLLPRRLPVTL